MIGRNGGQEGDWFGKCIRGHRTSKYVGSSWSYWHTEMYAAYMRAIAPSRGLSLTKIWSVLRRLLLSLEPAISATLMDIMIESSLQVT